MLVTKEVIAPGTYWYTDEKTGLPRKLDVSSDMTKWWHTNGSAMLASGLTVPVPYEHDFDQHPMTAKEKLLNNAGEVKEYILKDFDDPIRGKVKDALFSVVNIRDMKVKEKIGDGSIKWTSPWINSFTDGKGKKWTNVISHLALTTRPRIVDQRPFDSMAAALSLMNSPSLKVGEAAEGFCLSRAGLLSAGAPVYPIAFSMWSGAALGGFPPKKGKSEGGEKSKKPESEGGKPDGNPTPGEQEVEKGAEEIEKGIDKEGKEGGDGTGDGAKAPFGKQGEDDMSSLRDPSGDIAMEELLCDLLSALGIHLPEATGETEFKRHLYEAAMLKIKELTAGGLGAKEDPTKMAEDAKKTGDQKSQQMGKQNPIVGQVQQEQQPMYMSTESNMSTAPALSLEEISKLPDPTKSVALAMYAENQRLQAQLTATEKTTNSLRDAELRKATANRLLRCTMIGRISPKVKGDLDEMLKLASMAMSLGDDGNVVDPMSAMLNMLEKGLSDIPKILTTSSASLSVHPQPTDDNEMTEERSNELADEMARRMGCPPAKKAS